MHNCNLPFHQLCFFVAYILEKAAMKEAAKEKEGKNKTQVQH